MKRRLSLALGALALASCSDSSVAGRPVVDETTNGLQVRLTLPDGRPAAGARIAIAGSAHLAGDTSRVVHAVADASGRVDLPDLAPGRYRLEARWEGWGSLLEPELDSRGATVSSTLAPLGRMRLTTSPGCLVRAYGSDRSWIADASGLAVLDSLPPGTWNLRADSGSAGEPRLAGERAVALAPAESATVGGLDSLILDPSTWSGHQVLRLEADPQGSTEPLAEVPLPVRIGSEVFGAGLRAPSDLRIVDAHGQDLPFVVEDWDPAGGSALVWTRLPSTTPSRGDSLDLLWGKPGLPARPDPATDPVFGWWRLGALDASVADSGTTVVPGILGKGRRFDRTTSLRIRPPSDGDLAGGFTISCWVLAEGIQRPWAKILDLGGNAPPYGTILLDIDSATGRAGFQMAFSDSTWKRVSTLEPMSGWVHLAARWDPATRRATLFADGIAQGSFATDSTPLSVAGHMLVVGNQASGDDGLAGILDDLRFDLVPRSDAWIRHQAFLQAPDRIRAGDISRTP